MSITASFLDGRFIKKKANIGQLSEIERFANFLLFQNLVSNAAGGGAGRYIMNEVITGI